MMSNQKIYKILSEMAILLEMEGVAFKPQAYAKAAYSLESLNEDIKEIYKKGGIKALEEIPGFGKGIAERVHEYILTGKIKDYEKMKKKIPVNIEELNNIEGVGPKIIKTLYKELKIKNTKELEKAAKSGKLRKLPRFGEKLEKKILQSVEFQKKYKGKFLLGDILPLAENIKQKIASIQGVTKIEICGSLRRGKEIVRDIDILAMSKKPKLTMEAFTKLKEVDHIYAKGNKKTLVRLDTGIDADLRIVEKNSFGSALQYFTGSKKHNILLRKIAIQKGYKLNEYGLYKKIQNLKSKIQNYKSKNNKNSDNWEQIAGRTEEEIYEKLGLKYIPPELREMNGEIEAAQKNNLPELIELKNIKGDLQLQTNWTDGANSIYEMTEEAKKLNYEYVAITDHTQGLAMTGGSDEKKLLKQIKEIENINSKLGSGTSKFKILSGAEVNILKDGSLDIDDETLKKLDFVGAAIHSHFKLTKTEQTRRLIKAMENKHVDIIFHPTGRIINKREPIELDFEEIFKYAAETKTMLEINAHPSRLDLKDEHIRLAKKHGVKFMINTDAHSSEQMNLMKYGVLQARRGALEAKNIINALPLNQLLKFLKTPKDKR